MHSKADRCADWRREGEDGDKGDEDGLLSDLGVYDVEADGEALKELVHEDGDEEGQLILESDGKAHKHGMKRQPEEENEEGGVIEDVGEALAALHDDLLQLVLAVGIVFDAFFDWDNVIIELALVLAFNSANIF